MPLSEHVPRIDDRRYEDLVTEARTRIARYAPEWTPVWTDHNHSDPGITLVQLFAWLTEMLIYRLGKVPELNYLKFLQLLGIELQPAGPAIAEIAFPVLDTFTEPFVIVPERTQVAAEAMPGEPPIVFETERSLFALTASLASVQSYDGYSFKDLTASNQETNSFHPFGPEAKDDSALLLGFDYAGDLPRLQLDLAFWSDEALAGPALRACGLPQTPVYPSATLVWEYWSGKEWKAAGLLEDETAALTRSGHVLLKTPAPGETEPAALGAVAEMRHWIRARVTRGAFERPPKLRAVRTNTVRAIQAETVRHEVLGGSDGHPNQVFQLENFPVLESSLRVEVDEGEGFEAWQQVADFFASTPVDRHFTLNRTTGEIRFGDGRHGAIPVANIDRPATNIVAREYRFGGGKAGNVATGKTSTMVTPIEGIDEGGVTNLFAAQGGRDEEPLEQAKLRAPRALKSQCRAVTNQDFEHLASEVSSIRRAKALPLHHPEFPDIEVPGVVTVIVVPDSERPDPIPSEGTLRTVCEHLNQRRLLTTELYVIGPTYVEVEVSTELVAAGSANLAQVKKDVEAALLVYFHPLKGGEEGQGWPFGGDIYYSRVYQTVFSVPGVDRIEHLVITVEGETVPECQDICIPEGVLAFSTRHNAEASFELRVQ